MKDAKGHGSDARNGGVSVGPRQAAMARLEASGKIPAGTLAGVAGLLGAGSHSQSVQQVGTLPMKPALPPEALRT